MKFDNIYKLLNDNKFSNDIVIFSEYERLQKNILLSIVSVNEISDKVDKYENLNVSTRFPGCLYLDFTVCPVWLCTHVLYNKMTYNEIFNYIIELILDRKFTFASGVAILIDAHYSNFNKSCNLNTLH